MKTLVIHPDDRTTQMLEYVYKGHPEYTICRDHSISSNELKKLIVKHDRIIMLGHGLPAGLINQRRNGFLIDDSFASLLKTKDTLSMWCYSDAYFRKHNIPGFHTGMIISETTEELLMLGYKPLNEEEMLKNFKKISKCLGECIELEPKEIRSYMLEHYNDSDPVSAFNRKNFIII